MEILARVKGSIKMVRSMFAYISIKIVLAMITSFRTVLAMVTSKYKMVLAMVLFV